MRPIIAFLTIALFVGCASEEQADSRLLTVAGPIMGTRYSVKIVDPPKGESAVELRRAIDRRLDKLERLLSTYDENSEVSELNRSQSVQWFSVSRETAEAIAEGIHSGLFTEGAFDITCAPLVNLWGFGPERRPPNYVPPDKQIDQAKSAVGPDLVEYQLDPPAVRKVKPDVLIDLSGVAKGYAVDQLAMLLREAGITSFLIDIGGDMRAQGVNLEGQPWRIGIETPLPGIRSIHRVLELNNTALATSGDYRNYFALHGRRYSHIIDPRTGRPIQHRLVSVSVLDPSCARADALATGLMVLGPEDGFRVATEQKLPALLIVDTDAGFVDRMTPEFEAAFQPVR